MQNSRAQSSIGIGFFGIAVLFLAIIAIWLAMVSHNNANIRRLNRGELQRQLIFTMRDVAQQRNLALFRMAALQDAFERDAEYLRFTDSAGHFIAARQQLLKKYFDNTTADYWHRLKPLIQRSEKLQNTIVGLVMEDKNAAALKLIQQEFIPIQRRVSLVLSDMLASAREDILKKLDKTGAATQSYYQIILLLVLVATSLGYAIAKIVLRRSDEAQNLLLDKNRQIRALNDATSGPHTSIEQQIRNLLQLGCEYLSMENGVIVRDEAGRITNTISRYPETEELPADHSREFWEILLTTVKSQGMLLATIAALPGEHAALRGAMHEQNIATIIATSLNTGQADTYTVVLSHSKNSRISADANELIELISNKLAVLLDQQETLSQLQNAKLAAEAASKNKSVFLANLTSTLRTPLRCIIGHSAILQDKTRQLENLEFIEELQLIYESSQQLDSLIANLSDMAQLETGSMELQRQPVELEALLHDIETVLEPMVNKSDNQFSSQILNELGVIHSDSVRIRQILLSLLCFSGKLTRRGQITLTVWREPGPDDDWLFFEVKDTGSGFSKKQINNLFKLTFANSPEPDKTIINPQFPLAISKNICQLLGGDILVDSKPDHGTMFTVCLPCHSQKQETRTAVTG